MKKLLILALSFFQLLGAAYAYEIPANLKDLLKKEFPKVEFKIDNSFIVNDNLYLPLIIEEESSPINVKMIYSVPDKNDKDMPKLIWFSNNWLFVKVIKQDTEKSTIVDLSEIDEKYRERFLKAKFPGDLLIPKGLIINERLISILGQLPIEVQEQDQTKKTQTLEPSSNNLPSESITSQANKETKLDLKGILYLTSPDTGKVVYLKLSDPSMIYHIQTEGTPWEISFDKAGNLIFVTDFTKDKVYQIKPMQGSILKSFDLTSMSSPKDIKISEDGSLAFILESLSSNFVVYNLNEGKYFTKTTLPRNPNSFTFIKTENLIAITCPSLNKLVLLMASDFSVADQINIKGIPESIISGNTGSTLYITNRNENTILELDLKSKKVKNTFTVGETPVCLALHPNKNLLYVGNGKSNSISVIDLETNNVIDTIKLPIETQFPGDLEITQDGKWLIVTSETTNNISIIDLTLNIVAVKLDVGATTHAAYLIESKEQ